MLSRKKTPNRKKTQRTTSEGFALSDVLNQQDDDKVCHEEVLHDTRAGKIHIKRDYHTHSTANSHERKWQQWKVFEKERRSTEVSKFSQMTPKTASIKSQLFLQYQEDVLNALIYFKKFQHQWNLTTRPKPNPDGSEVPYDDIRDVIKSVDMMLIFVFGIFPKTVKNTYGMDTVPMSFRTLTCLWSWNQLVQAGSQNTVIQHYKEAFGYEDMELDKPYFLLNTEVVKHHTMGSLLFRHIHQLDVFMRGHYVRDFVTHPWFPRFKRLEAPQENDSFIVLEYNFELMEYPEWDKLIFMPFCPSRGEFCIYIDGPMTRLLPEPLNDICLERFSQGAVQDLRLTE